RCFVQPLDPETTTNLFIWTASERLSYEVLPAPSVEESTCLRFLQVRRWHHSCIAHSRKDLTRYASCQNGAKSSNPQRVCCLGSPSRTLAQPGNHLVRAVEFKSVQTAEF